MAPKVWASATWSSSPVPRAPQATRFSWTQIEWLGSARIALLSRRLFNERPWRAARTLQDPLSRAHLHYPRLTSASTERCQIDAPEVMKRRSLVWQKREPAPILHTLHCEQSSRIIPVRSSYVVLRRSCVICAPSDSIGIFLCAHVELST